MTELQDRGLIAAASAGGLVGAFGWVGVFLIAYLFIAIWIIVKIVNAPEANRQRVIDKDH
jgi:hypothetical protein